MAGDGSRGTRADDGANSSLQDSRLAGIPTDGDRTDGGNGSPFPFKPAYILGADISWETQHEAEGYTYSDGMSTKTMTALMAENGFNFIRLRTFVEPSASDGYSPGENWCGQADTVTLLVAALAAGSFHFVEATQASPGFGTKSATSRPSRPLR